VEDPLMRGLRVLVLVLPALLLAGCTVYPSGYGGYGYAAPPVTVGVGVGYGAPYRPYYGGWGYRPWGWGGYGYRPYGYGYGGRRW
jgi:hypothetical protein